MPEEIPGKLIPFSQIRNLDWLPDRRNGARLSIQTPYRWHLVGLRGKDGQKHRLKAARVGGSLCTCEQWLREFFLALARIPDDQPVPVSTSREHERAEARLAVAGL